MYTHLIDNIIRILNRFPPCLFRKVTGLYCPGCGGIRATKALLTGHPVISLTYNPIVLYTFVTIIILTVRLIRACIYGQNKSSILLPDAFLYIALIIVIVHCIYKNLGLIL